jgi:hypothetical protein
MLRWTLVMISAFYTSIFMHSTQCPSPSQKGGIKGKAVIVTCHGGPQGWEISRLQSFLDHQPKDGGEAVGLKQWQPFTPERFLVHISVMMSQPQDHTVAQRIRLHEKSNDRIGNWIQDLPACNTVL